MCSAAVTTTASDPGYTVASCPVTSQRTTYGGELLGTVQRGRWFGWLAYAYSHSTRVDEPGAERRADILPEPLPEPARSVGGAGGSARDSGRP